jgi:hypothetical protein
MCKADTFTESPFTLHCLEDFVPVNHSLRPIRQMVNEALVKMDGLFAGICTRRTSKAGGPALRPRNC